VKGEVGSAVVLTIACRLTQNLLICGGSALTVPVHEPSYPARASILPGIPSTAFLAADGILMAVPGKEGVLLELPVHRKCRPGSDWLPSACVSFCVVARRALGRQP